MKNLSEICSHNPNGGAVADFDTCLESVAWLLAGVSKQEGFRAAVSEHVTPG